LETILKQTSTEEEEEEVTVSKKGQSRNPQRRRGPRGFEGTREDSGAAIPTTRIVLKSRQRFAQWRN
jgi:hypothetical protein